MSMGYARTGSGDWVGRIGSVRVWLSDENGAPNRAQAHVAALVTGSLPALRDRAAAYLDLFVDRGQACGAAQEPWWLDEVDVRGPADADRPRYALLFTLHGDDGGLWTVEMRVSGDGHRPFRFERLQG